MKNWTIFFHNDLDADFGFDCGAVVYMHGLDKSVAKSIAKHMNKVTPDFVYYFAEASEN